MNKGISRKIGRFTLDRLALGGLILAAIGLSARSWLADHPQHNPWAPLEVNHPIGWTTSGKLADLRGDSALCYGVLERSAIAFTALDDAGEGTCQRMDRTILPNAPLRPEQPQMSCLVATAFEIWMENGVKPAAQEILGSQVDRVEHLGTYNCRRINGGNGGNWSEHATGNAIDIAAFVLDDGRRITLLADWEGDDPEARFLREVRQAACGIYSTVLSPDYNAAHADHFHLDQADRSFGSVCR